MEDGVCRFLGIRYAVAERFSYPEEVTCWDGLYNAHRYGDAPVQKMAFDPVDCDDPGNFFEHETMQGVSCRYSEDCLNLNIWAPAGAENAPVAYPFPSRKTMTQICPPSENVTEARPLSRRPVATLIYSSNSTS